MYVVNKNTTPSHLQLHVARMFKKTYEARNWQCNKKGICQISSIVVITLPESYDGSGSPKDCLICLSKQQLSPWFCSEGLRQGPFEFHRTPQEAGLRQYVSVTLLSSYLTTKHKGYTIIPVFQCFVQLWDESSYLTSQNDDLPSRFFAQKVFYEVVG